MEKYTPFQFEGFKLIRLAIRNKLLGDNVYQFVDSGDQVKSLYTTVLIGPNGSGKSNVLSTILYLFKELSHLKNGEKRTYDVLGDFSLTYSLNGDIYEFTNVPEPLEEMDGKLYWPKVMRQITLLLNGLSIDFSEVQFPLAIVAQSIMLTDRFPVITNEQEKDKFPFYNYLGVRNRPQQASTRSYVRKTVEFVVNQMMSKAFKNGLKRITEFLEVGESVFVQYRTKNNNQFFDGSLDYDKLNKHFVEIKNKYSRNEKQPPFAVDYYFRNINSDTAKAISEYCNRLYAEKRLNWIKRSPSKHIRFDITSDEDHSKISEEYEHLEHLRSLGLITTPDIRFCKKGSDLEFDIQESSSGEYHVFSTMVGLLASIKTNSLLLIDEPEISLHPNWQMKFLTFLNEIFRHEEYSTCHVVIATHSHFLISDLQGADAKIIGLKKKKNEIKTIDFKANTYGWSAEEVLYKVFDVLTTRNYYVASEINEILDEFSKAERDNDFLREKVEVLFTLNESLSSNDPLKDVVEKLISNIDLK